MTKEEKIKEAWGLAYDEVKHLLTDNGYIQSVDLAHIRLNLRSYNLDLNYNDIDARPKSLKGIENNNGWIKIESEDDLPKENGYFFTKSDVWWEPYYRIDVFCGKLANSFENGKSCFTHYQPIQKPKPPIY